MSYEWSVCPICKKPVAIEGSRSTSIAKTVRHYHGDCYDILLARLDALFEVLTGPTEEFEAWLWGNEEKV